MHSFRSENPAPYNVAPYSDDDDELIIRALKFSRAVCAKTRTPATA